MVKFYQVVKFYWVVEFYQVFVQELYKAMIGTMPIPKSKSRSNSTRYLYRICTRP